MRLASNPLMAGVSLLKTNDDNNSAKAMPGNKNNLVEKCRGTSELLYKSHSAPVRQLTATPLLGPCRALPADN